MSDALTPDDIDFLRSLPASTDSPIGGTREQRRRADDLPWGLLRECRRTDLGDFVVAQANSIAKLRDQILDYQQSLHVAEQECDGWRKRHGDVTIDRDHALAMVAEANAEIARLKGTMIEPTEQTGDEDSEQ